MRLHLRLLLEDAQRSQVVFDLFEASEHGLTVGGNGAIVGRARLIGLRAAQTTVEQGLRCVCADRPEPARHGQPFGRVAGLETT